MSAKFFLFKALPIWILCIGGYLLWDGHRVSKMLNSQRVAEVPQSKSDIKSVNNLGVTQDKPSATWNKENVCIAGISTYFFLKAKPRVIKNSSDLIILQSAAGNEYTCMTRNDVYYFTWHNKSGELKTSDKARFKIKSNTLTVLSDIVSKTFNINEFENISLNSQTEYHDLKPLRRASRSTPIEDWSGILETPQFPKQKLVQLIDPATKMIKAKNMRCDSVSSIRPLIKSRGFKMVCNNYSYKYTFKDIGGQWHLTAG